MKNKILFILIMLTIALFTFNVEAKTCKYRSLIKKQYEGKTLKQSEDYNSQIVSATYSYNNLSEGITVWAKMTSPESLSCTIANWSSPVYDTTDTGKAFATSEECPKNLVFISTVVNFNCSAYVAASQSTANTIIDKNIDSTLLSVTQKNVYLLENVQSSGSQSSDTDVDTQYSSCLDFQGEYDCEGNEYYSCLYVEKKFGDSTVKYCNFDDLTYVRCGGAWDIPNRLPIVVSFLVNLLKIFTPIILVFVSVISLVKAVASSKEDEIKKAQSLLIKRLIAAALVFLVIEITQFVIVKVADKSESENVSSCLNCFLNNKCSSNTYFKTEVGGSYKCTFLNNLDVHEDCDKN